jgi:glycosyltransferase involved in cell wall biosynthesis
LARSACRKKSRVNVALRNVTRLKLVVVHSHYRPGGVRRVIELALPSVAAALRPRVMEIVLAGGEAPDDGWLAGVQRSVPGLPVTLDIDPSLGYLSEQRAQPAVIDRRIRGWIERRLAGVAPRGAVVWLHNPGLGRNVLLAKALAIAGEARGVPVLFHHHDWWFDNRWARWAEMRRAGFRTLEAVARAVLPVLPGVRHAAINLADTGVLRRRLGSRAGWVPNPAGSLARPTAARVQRARCWTRAEVGIDGPVWLVPCRLLRRKNLAEALLLTRWLRPEAWLVTTGGVSSADERKYAAALGAAARRHGWRLRLGVLAKGGAGSPTVSDLLAASEAVLLTSLQEGFGLPNLEAAAAGRPLIARTLPNIAPDLARFGFRFPQSYEELWVDPPMFDLRAERARQRARWQAWRKGLPAVYRDFADRPAVLATRDLRRPVPFSRLTLTAQLQVLAQDPADSWSKCAPLNPRLASWRARAAAGALEASTWPRGAEKWLGGDAYGRRLAQLLRPVPEPGRASSGQGGVRATADFIRAKLAGTNQYPLLWDTAP